MDSSASRSVSTAVLAIFTSVSARVRNFMFRLQSSHRFRSLQ